MAKTVSGKRKQQQRQAVLRLVILSAILVCCNILAMQFHYRLDLTEDGRFTLSKATKRMLQQMDETATVTVYLEGKDFPAGLQRLRDATRERLQAFRELSGNKVVFRFIDPFAEKDEKEKMLIGKQLAEKGIYPSGLNVSKDERLTQQWMFPYALVSYKGREMAVKLLESSSGAINPGVINYSETQLEYKLANAIHMLSLPDKRRIAYIVGHGEPLGVQTWDMLTTLAQYYHVDTIDLTQEYYIPLTEELIIINRPTEPFDDKDKFKIDQYVMRGGHVLWALDMLHTPIDSLRNTQQFLAMDYGLNLDDMLFRYGVRVNSNLIEDIQCTSIPVALPTASPDKPELRLFNWIYFPVFTPSSRHPIVHNMDAIVGMFVNSIDTIASSEIKKTILLESSKYSRVAPSPVRVNLAMLQYQPRPEMFNRPHRPVAVLLEGRFRSIFRNRLHPGFLAVLRDSLKQDFKVQADREGSMIVVSDGDMFLNGFDRAPEEMGYWRYTRERFANKSFFLNCVEYLTDSTSLLEARSKDTRLRLLDAGRAKNEKNRWTVINTGIPVALVLVFASVYLFFRKRRYEGRD
jgi:ABC-2 type transport system permease protein